MKISPSKVKIVFWNESVLERLERLNSNTAGLSKRLKNLFYYCAVVVMTGLLSVIVIDRAYADYVEDLQEKTVDSGIIRKGAAAPSAIQPISGITLEDFYYSNYAQKRYCLENSEGRCLDKKFNLFTTLEGKGHYDDLFYVYYKTELNEDGQVRLKKAYGLLKTGIWSLEIGKDTVWMGQGYHGSLLLSNNAEGFLLVRLRTEDSFRLPWIFSSIGEFRYDIFRGWSNNSSLLGHRLSYRPVPLLELGANQVAYIPEGKHYNIEQYPHIFVSSNENSGNGKSLFDNDQKASLDIALEMPFLSKIPPLVNGKLYAEYGGNDSYAIWQKEDRSRMESEPTWKKLRWPFQFDFLNIGWLTGLFLTTGDIDFRVEYAQNYASYPIFYDLYAEWGDVNRRHGPWYTDLNSRNGIIMGHEMGNNADDLFFELTIRHHPAALTFIYDQQHHWLKDNWEAPHSYETKHQYGVRPSYRFSIYTVFADLIYNHYRNVDYSADPTTFDIHPGTRLDEYIAGLGVAIAF